MDLFGQLGGRVQVVVSNTVILGSGVPQHLLGTSTPRCIELLSYRRLGGRLLQQLTRYVNGDILLGSGVPQRLLGTGTFSLLLP